MPAPEVDIAFGLPCEGYADSRAKQFVPLNKLCTGSVEALYNPQDKSWRNRQGTAMHQGYGAGLLEQKQSFRCRRAREFPLRGTTVNRAVGSLWTNEANGKGCFHFSDDDTVAGSTMLGMVIGTYTTEQFINMPVVGRARTAAQRAGLLAGSADFRAVQAWMYFGDYDTTPIRWNMGVSALGSSSLQVSPWGDFPPPRMPRITHVAAAESATIGKFTTGQYFAVAIAYIKSDGSYTMPLMPKMRRELDTAPGTPQSTAWAVAASWDTADLGYYLVAGASTYVQNCRIYDIPIGPADVVGRVLFRTEQAASMAAVDLTTMAVWEVIRDNRTTELRSHKGDGEIRMDPAVYRLDHQMAPRSKYMTVHEQRVWVAHVKPSIVALAVCPNVNANVIDSLTPTAATFNGVAYVNTAYTVTVENVNDGDALPAGVDVRIAINIGPPAGLAASTTLSIATGSEMTIEDVIDYFNNAIGANAAGPVAGVHLVAAPNFPITTKATALRSTMGVDYGDNATFNPVPAVATGQVRAWSSAFPAVLYVNPSRMGWEYEEQRMRRAVYFTGGGPLHAAYAANSFYVGNVRFVPEEAGDIVGIGSTRAGLVVFCSNGAYIIENTRDANTNVDEDYTVRELNKERKFIAPDTVCEGDGWCVALSTVGVVATDGQKMSDVNLSADIYDDFEKRGSLANEIALCLKATAIRDYDGQKCVISNDGTNLYLSYRRTGDTIPTRMFVYSFGVNRERTGLSALLSDKGTPLGWSTPCSYNSATGRGGCGPCVTMVKNAGGTVTRRTLMFPTFVGSAADGLIVEIESAGVYADEGAGGAVAVMRFPPYIGSGEYDLRALWLEVMAGLEGNVLSLTSWGRFLLGEAEDSTGETYSLDIAGGSTSMRSTEFDASLLDKSHQPRLAFEMNVTGEGRLTLWGVRVKASQHIRR